MKSFEEKEKELKLELKKCPREYETFKELEKETRELVDEIFQENYIFVCNFDKHNAYEDTFFTVKDITSDSGYSFTIDFYIVEENQEKNLVESYVIGG